MKPCLRKTILFLLFLSSFIPAGPAEESKPIPTAIHLHSSVSSGARTISEMAALAIKQNVKALILTDLFYERYEYGLWPLRSVLKKTFERNSIMKSGTKYFFQQIEKARAENPQVLVIDGAAVTPFYFWTGGLWPGPLILNNRGKDFLVLGLGDPQKYEKLPITDNGSSRFDAYSGDQYSKPYQLLIDYVQKERGLVFWSHPAANEHILFEHAFFGLNVYLDTPAYEESLLNTFHYDGFGVVAVELAMIQSPGYHSIASVQGIWDRVLLEYCQGKRLEPVWAIGETDFNGFPQGIKNLDSILNMVLAPSANRENILGAIKRGRVYLIIPASHTERLILDEFSVTDGATGNKALIAGTIPLKALPIIKIQAHFSEESKGTLQLLLIKDGEVIQQWHESVPFDIQFQDPSNTEPGKSYYRILAYSEDSSHRLLTNPIFTERK